VPNGKLFMLRNGAEQIPVVHVWGTSYQKGYAQGQLMKDGAVKFVARVWRYIEDEVIRAINGSGVIIPEQIARWLADVGLDTGLDITYQLTKNYTLPHFEEELRGLANATGIDFLRLRRMHLIGELTQGACSMFGAWGAALPGGDGLLTMRGYDWITDGPFQDFPQITVYHASAPSENTFITVGWTGWVGSLGGVNDQKISVHHISAAFPDESFGNQSRVGTPFTYILRDIMQFDRTRTAGVSRLKNAKRTCNLILGVGDGKERRFNSLQYSGSVCNAFDDTNLMPLADWHPRLSNVVYHGMDWICPPFNIMLHDMLRKHHGNITAENAIREIIPMTKTGNLHVWVSDVPNEIFYVAFARQEGNPGEQFGFDRGYYRLELKSLWAVTS